MSTLLLSAWSPAQAATVSLGWIPSPDPSVRGYRIYYGLQGQSLSNWVSVGVVSTGSVSGLASNATYSFAVSAYNDAGIESALSPTVSTTTGTSNGTSEGATPSVVLAGTSNSTSPLIAPAKIDLRADVSPNGAVVSRVDFLSGATVLGTDSTAPYACSWSGITAGNYSVVARVYYSASSYLDSVAFALSVAPPVVAGGADSPLVALTSPTDGSLRIAGLSIGLSASVTPNGHSISKVQFFDGNRLLGEDSNAPYVCFWSSVPVGQYAVSARAIYDGSLTVGSAVAAVTVEDPPTISIASPTAGACAGAPATIQLAAKVAAKGHSLVKVRYYSGSLPLGEAVTAPYNVSYSGLGVGNYPITAVLYYDSSRKVASEPVTFSVLEQPPAIRLATPVDGSTVVLPSSVPFSAVVTPNGYSISKVQFLVDSAVVGESIGPRFGLAWPASVAGTYAISARLYFGEGSTIDSKPVSLTVANPPPTVAVSSPTDGRFLNSGSSIRFEASVGPLGNTIERVEFLDGGTLVGVDATAPYAVDWTPSVNGAHLLKARVVYNGGKSTISQGVQVTVGGLPPPWISLDIAPAGQPGSSEALDNGFRISGSGAIYGGSDSFRFVYQTMDGDGEIQARVVSTSGTGSAGVVGVMIRESTAPGSRHALMGVAPTEEWRWERRGDTGGITGLINYGSVGPPFAWVRLVRAGDACSGYTSTDGISWVRQNTRTVVMGTSVLVGLAVSSGTAGVLNTTEFSEVIVRP